MMLVLISLVALSLLLWRFSVDEMGAWLTQAATDPLGWLALGLLAAALWWLRKRRNTP